MPRLQERLKRVPTFGSDVSIWNPTYQPLPQTQSALEPDTSPMPSKPNKPSAVESDTSQQSAKPQRSNLHQDFQPFGLPRRIPLPQHPLGGVVWPRTSNHLHQQHLTGKTQHMHQPNARQQYQQPSFSVNVNVKPSRVAPIHRRSKPEGSITTHSIQGGQWNGFQGHGGSHMLPEKPMKNTEGADFPRRRNIFRSSTTPMLPPSRRQHVKVVGGQLIALPTDSGKQGKHMLRRNKSMQPISLPNLQITQVMNVRSATSLDHVNYESTHQHHQHSMGRSSV